MSRIIIIIAGVVAALAVVAVAAVMIGGTAGGDQPAPAPAEAVVTDEGGATTDEAAEAAPADTKARRIGRYSVADEAESAAASESAESPSESSAGSSDGKSAGGQPASSAAKAGGASGQDVSGKMRSLLRKLSPAEREELARQLDEAERDKANQQAKYGLPSQERMAELGRRGGAYRLTDAQRQQIEALDTTMKDRLTAALTPVWTREAQLRQQSEALRQSGRNEEAESLSAERRDLRLQRESVKQNLDKEYQLMLAGVLSAEQMRVISSGGNRSNQQNQPNSPNRDSDRRGPPSGRR